MNHADRVPKVQSDPRVSFSLRIVLHADGKVRPEGELQELLYAHRDEIHAWLVRDPKHAALFVSDPLAAVRVALPKLAARLPTGDSPVSTDLHGLRLSNLAIEVRR